MRLDVNGTGCYAYTGSRAMDADRPTIVFVHGAANDHSVWALQSRYFRAPRLQRAGGGSSGSWPFRRRGARDGRGDRRLDPAGSRCGRRCAGRAGRAFARRAGRACVRGAACGARDQDRHARPRRADAGQRRSARRGEGRRPRRLRADQRLVVFRRQAAGRQCRAGHVDDRQCTAPHGAQPSGRALYGPGRLRDPTTAVLPMRRPCTVRCSRSWAHAT